ncbi:membrane protein insertase YidC [Nocardioides dilutus]
MGALKDLWGFIVAPLYIAISAVLIGWHNLFGRVFGEASGAAWVLSIVGLTLVIRAALIPLFVKQIKSSRNMQLIQPKVKELQKKFGHDRERLAQETMKLYKDSGTNPFASCLPILLQMPIFFTLFSLLNNAAKEKPKGILSKADALQFGEAKLFGTVKISDTFLKADGDPATMALAAFLVLAMTATTFLTQRQLMSKNMPKDALTGPYAQQQKLLLYVLPVVFAVGGIAFPIGVLFYWTTSNLWTMGQQFYVIRNNPAPGTEAERAKLERDKAKAIKKGLVPVEEVLPEPEPKRPAQRQQPQRQPRSKRKGAAGPKPPAGTTAASPAPEPAPQPDPSSSNGQAITPKQKRAPAKGAPNKAGPTKAVPNKNRKKR